MRSTAARAYAALQALTPQPLVPYPEIPRSKAHDFAGADSEQQSLRGFRQPLKCDSAPDGLVREEAGRDEPRTEEHHIRRFGFL